MTHPDQSWRYAWGTPEGFFWTNRKPLETAFLLAFLLHLAPFGLLWKKHLAKKAEPVVTLQSVDLIEPEVERPAAAPPPVEVQKPKSAFEFLKMALPSFRKPEAPRDIAPQVKASQPKVAEPEKLIEKIAQPSMRAPEIRLDAARPDAPRIAEIAKVSPAASPRAPARSEPALNLEEVGRRAVAPPPQAPAIQLGGQKAEKAADLASIPKSPMTARSAQPAERLVDRSPPTPSYKSAPPPLGYERRGGGVSLDQPRDVARSAAKPQIEAVVPKQQPAAQAVLSIAKDGVTISGPLQGRKVVEMFRPKYPDWAAARNIEADVAIRFTVSAEGLVLGNAVVERTSGYTELDKLAMEALKKWKFSRLAGGAQDQWGVVTFRYRLE